MRQFADELNLCKGELAPEYDRGSDRLFRGDEVYFTYRNGEGESDTAVYLDLVILLNFGVDLLLLIGTNRLSGYPPGWGRCLWAAALGGVYSGICMMPGFRFLGNALWRIVFLGIMGSIAFGWRPGAVRRTGVFFLLTMAMGGLALGFGSNHFGILLASGVIIWGLCRIGFGKRIGGREYVDVTIGEGQRTVRLTALRDTGNTLTDPVTGEQVLIVGAKEAETLVGLSWEQLAHPMETLLQKPVSGLRLIPYSAVGQPGGMLLAKRLETVFGGRKCTTLVAFAPARIGAGDVYQALTGGV